MEYITLAKTRLTDMKVSIEDMGLYEDLSAQPDKTKPQCQAQQDVLKAVHIFQNTSKIPSSVMEASIFRRQYFTSRFLPALLAPRVLPAAPDPQMLLIDALKRADKIPMNLYITYTDACEQEMSRMQEGRIKMDVSLQEEPLGKLKSSLWDLRPLVTDVRFSEVSAQVALISDRLSAVMRSGSREDALRSAEPVIPASRIKLEAQDQAVSDLLLTCFCQCVMAASSSNPPDRQGQWACLYVKMLCGHPAALSSVLSRMLQLLCDQAHLLKDAHVVGLAAFSIHLHECQTALPASYTRVNSLEPFWEILLSPQCSDSMLVCLRFCVAATCYASSKFSLLSPGAAMGSIPLLFLRKLQHLVPRLVWETRGELVREVETDTPLTWRSLSLPSPAWKDAVLTLWNQRHLQELLRQQSVQLSLKDWLLSEMALNTDKDVLCDTERQDYQRWAVNHFYLPEPTAAGGCDGDLEKACTIIVDAALEFTSRSGLSSTGSQRDMSQSHSRTGLADILCRLQELVCDLLTGSHSGSGQIVRSHFLFEIFRQRLAATAGSLELCARLTRHGDVGMCCRILLGLPPLLLINTPSDQETTTLNADDFFKFVNEDLKNLGPRSCALPYHITTHFLRGALTSSAQCEDPSEAVNSFLASSRSACPIILTSAALWWSQLYPVLRCQWNQLFGGDMPKEIEALQELHTAVNSCPSPGLLPPLPGAPWISAAFLHFTFQQKMLDPNAIREYLADSRTKTPILVSVLFFSIMDLIPALLKEGSGHIAAQDTCLQIIHSLEERGDSWLSLFQLTEQQNEPVRSLHRTASEEFLKLLPFAFYSLVPSLPIKKLVLQQSFLPVAVQMYVQLMQLFVDGNAFAASSLRSDYINYHDALTKGRSFLLSCVPRFPKPSSSFSSQIMEWCAEYDPELASLLRTLHPSHDHYHLGKEPDLF
ncbi:Fanconi anemia group A protein [Pelodytes ibericus]